MFNMEVGPQIPKEPDTKQDIVRWIRLHWWRLLIGVSLAAGSIPLARAAFRNSCTELYLNEKTYHDISCRLPGNLVIEYNRGLVPNPEAPYATDLSLLKSLENSPDELLAKVGVIQNEDGSINKFYYWPRPPEKLK